MFLFTEKYRPRTVQECILPPRLKTIFQSFVDKNQIPNLLLTGGPGIGKTSVARAMMDQLELEYIIKNGSLHGNIDMLRNEITTFASSVSMFGGRKYVILDEADFLNPQSTQPALRNFMEEYAGNCGFIFTCNYPSKILKELRSRLSLIDFTLEPAEKPALAGQFLKRVKEILTAENIDFNAQVIANVITTHFPDFRRVLNELQKYAATGSINSGILVNLADESFNVLIQFMKDKQFSEVRKWVVHNSNIDPTNLFRTLYDKSVDTMQVESIPQLVLILAEYQYRQAFVADPEINVMACLTQIMSECQFK